MHAVVHAADIQDRDGGALVMATLFGMFPFLLKLYADGGYQGPEFRRALKKILTRVNIEIVKRSDQAKGFVVLPKRWIVERTFAWLGRCRRRPCTSLSVLLMATAVEDLPGGSGELIPSFRGDANIDPKSGIFPVRALHHPE